MQYLIIATLSLSAFGAAATGDVDGSHIQLEAGQHMRLQAPLELPFDGPGPDGRVRVLEGSTGKEYPATIRNGRFTFIPEGAMPETSHTYEVKVYETEVPEVVQIEKAPEANALEVRVFDKHVTTFHYNPEERKPYLWPVNAKGGVPVTRAWPMGEKMLTDDHPHHRSLYTAHGDVNGADCWLEREDSGWQHVKDVQWGSGDAYGWITAQIAWEDAERKPVVEEEREYRFYGTPAGVRLIDVRITFTAAHGDVVFGDTKEGGLLSVRVRDDITEEQGGVMLNSAGKEGTEACWGKPADWMDYSGAIEDGNVYGIAIFDHPDNPRHPTTWHARGYGLFTANCFGYSHFMGEGHNGDYTLPAGDSVTFQYRVYIHAGDAEKAAISDRYTDYALPPDATWLEE